MSDFRLQGGRADTVLLLFPQTDDGKEWAAIHIDANAQMLGEGIAIENRYVDPILEGIQGDGLTIQWGEATAIDRYPDQWHAAHAADTAKRKGNG